MLTLLLILHLLFGYNAIEPAELQSAQVGIDSDGYAYMVL